MAKSEGINAAPRRSSLGEQVTEQLRERIIAGGYAPGERLTEVRLSLDFGVSRVPVREALRTMESEGFVLTTSYTERVVAEMSPTEVRDLYELREAVELLTVARAAERRDPAGRRDLIALLSEGMNLVADGDDDGLASLNARFHRAIAAATGSALLMATFNQLDAKIRWSHLARGDARWRDSWQEHSSIVQAIITGDAKQAQSLMHTHLRALEAQAAERTTG
jgi:DNA-binding GntR family transcriptional regulator